jgi:hypothetical protein
MPFLDDSIITIPDSNIITSENTPANPQVGDMWNELDNEGNLIQKWNYINNQWIGDLVNLSFPDVSMSQAQIYQLDSRFNLFVRNFYGSYFSSNPMPSNGILARRLMLGNRSNLLASNIAGAITFSGKVAGILDSVTTKVNRLFNIQKTDNDTNSSKINLIGNYPSSSGTFTISINSYFVSAGFTYQLVRK